jgi:hypothetical protein
MKVSFEVSVEDASDPGQLMALNRLRDMVERVARSEDRTIRIGLITKSDEKPANDYSRLVSQV